MFDSNSGLIAAPPPPYRFRFYDCAVELWSDSAAYVEPFCRLYHQFAVADFPPAASPLQIRILTQPTPTVPVPVLYIGDTALPLHNPAILEGVVYSHLVNSILAHVSSHLLIHAGALSWQDQGVLLLGDSRFGKTTLTLALLQRGFSILSDEFAALDRADGYIDPFPRYLSVRPPTFDLLDLPIPPEAVDWLGKVAFAPEHIRAESLARRTPLRHVFVLEGPETASTQDPGDQLVVVVDRLETPLQQAIAAIPGVSHLQVGQRYGYPSLAMRAVEKTPILIAIEERCRLHGAVLLDYIKQEQEHPDFHTHPQATPLPRSAASLALLQGFQLGHRAHVFQDEYGGNPVQLLFALSAMLDRADCYRLRVGPIHETADLVCTLVQ